MDSTHIKVVLIYIKDILIELNQFLYVFALKCENFGTRRCVHIEIVLVKKNGR